MEFLRSVRKLDAYAAEFGADARLCSEMLGLAKCILLEHPEEGLARTVVEWEELLHDMPEDAYGFSIIRDECESALLNSRDRKRRRADNSK